MTNTKNSIGCLGRKVLLSGQLKTRDLVRVLPFSFQANVLTLLRRIRADYQGTNKNSLWKFPKAVIFLQLMLNARMYRYHCISHNRQ